MLPRVGRLFGRHVVRSNISAQSRFRTLHVARRTPRGKGFALLGVALVSPISSLASQPGIRIHETPPPAITKPTHKDNEWFFIRWFHKILNTIRMIIRTSSLIFVGSILITSGFVAYGIPFMPEFTRRWWRVLLVTALGACGACSTKLGQWAATRPDLFPASICKELTDLHTRAPSHSFRHTKRILWRTYQREIDAVFYEFDNNVLASGAIAQVHKAVYYDPKTETYHDVVVKVRHPHVVENVAMDLRILRALGTMVEYLPGLKWMSVRQNIESFAMQMEEQLNMRTEGKNLEQFRHNFRDFPNIVFPEPFMELSNEEVLVESYESGIQVSEYFKDSNAEFFVNLSDQFKEEIASLGFNTFLKMLFIDNFVHGDLHPGNVLVRENPNGTNGHVQIVLLDAGLVIKLNDRDRQNFLDLFAAVAAGNGKVGAQLMIERSQATIPTPELQEKFKVEMKEIFESVTSRPLGEIPIGRAFFSVMKLCRECHVRIDGSFSALITGLVVVEGLARALNAQFDLLAEASPLLARDRNFVMAYLRKRL